MEQLVSIIVPIYNVEKYIKECIDSIINQTYKNLEIILVDDGSPDSCPKICDEYSKKDKRIKVIHKENGGLSSARNAGLDVAKGEYVSFIDSDDIVDEKFIETLYNLCIENNCDISECNFQRFEKDIVKSSNNCEIKVQTNHEMQERLYIPKYFARGIVVWNKLYKKYLYDDVRFPIGKLNEDEFTTYKVLYKCETSICVTEEELYYYRVNENSIMGKKFTAKRLDALEAYEERMSFYKNLGELELYKLTNVRYQETIESYFMILMESDKSLRKYIHNITRKARKNYSEYSKCIDSKKIKKFIFAYFPFLYYYLLKIKRKLKVWRMCEYDT